MDFQASECSNQIIRPDYRIPRKADDLKLVIVCPKTGATCGQLLIQLCLLVLASGSAGQGPDLSL